jgi:hypothetical protein
MIQFRLLTFKNDSRQLQRCSTFRHHLSSILFPPFTPPDPSSGIPLNSSSSFAWLRRLNGFSDFEMILMEGINGMDAPSATAPRPRQPTVRCIHHYGDFNIACSRFLAYAALISSCLAVSSLKVDTTVGTVYGLVNGTTPNVAQLLGIPYAEPPVGARRWLPPTANLPVSSIDATSSAYLALSFRAQVHLFTVSTHENS